VIFNHWKKKSEEIKLLRANLEVANHSVEVWSGLADDLKSEIWFLKKAVRYEQERTAKFRKELEFAKEQAILQKQERRAIYEQRDEARRMVESLMK
jgi:hypothetical protein